MRFHLYLFNVSVSTHSRPKAAGYFARQYGHGHIVSTRSRPKAAGNPYRREGGSMAVSTHSRPKAAERLAAERYKTWLFQHTAARRRLKERQFENGKNDVSTHSRPKAADHNPRNRCGHDDVSTHSRPKAAGRRFRLHRRHCQFQHTAARRRLRNLVGRHIHEGG